MSSISFKIFAVGSQLNGLTNQNFCVELAKAFDSADKKYHVTSQIIASTDNAYKHDEGVPSNPRTTILIEVASSEDFDDAMQTRLLALIEKLLKAASVTPLEKIILTKVKLDGEMIDLKEKEKGKAAAL